MYARRPPASLRRALAPLGAALLLAACGESAKLPLSAGIGPSPQLPAPNKTLLPTIHIAPAAGWPPDGEPRTAPGTEVAAFARDLAHPRWLYVLPNGDVLVAETNAPERPGRKGVKTWFMNKEMAKAGAGVPSADRITLLRDADGDGRAETRHVLLQGLHSPFGMALVGTDFYVANADAVMRFTYNPGDTRIGTSGTRSLPSSSRSFTTVQRAPDFGSQAMPLGLRRPLAKTRCLPLFGSISQMAARPASSSMPCSATLLLEPTVA